MAVTRPIIVQLSSKKNPNLAEQTGHTLLSFLAISFCQNLVNNQQLGNLIMTYLSFAGYDYTPS